MNASAQLVSQKSKPFGFTLVEVLIAVSIMGILAAVSGSYFLTQQTKSRLRFERDNVVAALEFARQNAAAAKEGTSYSLEFNSANTYQITPGGKPKKLSGSVVFDPLPNPISFNILTGWLQSGTSETITLVLGDFVCTVRVSESGIITASEVEPI